MATMLRFMLGTLAASLLGIGLLHAHEAENGRIQVAHPWALPAKAGEATKVYMTITNADTQARPFFGLHTPEADRAEIRFASPTGIGTLESIAIEGEGKLSLGTSHMWIELVALRRELRIGDSFAATLAFADYEVPINIIVGLSSDNQ
jgi:copper(I)-binding protein